MRIAIRYQSAARRFHRLKRANARGITPHEIYARQSAEKSVKSQRRMWPMRSFIVKATKTSGAVAYC